MAHDELFSVLKGHDNYKSKYGWTVHWKYWQVPADEFAKEVEEELLLTLNDSLQKKWKYI